MRWSRTTGAGLGIDRAHDDADQAAGRRVSCPLLFLWAARDDMEYLYGDPLAVWRGWADDVRGQSIDCGHHMAEEAPEELAAQLTGFFGARQESSADGMGWAPSTDVTLRNTS
jgi:haloacetate dehalogenase